MAPHPQDWMRVTPQGLWCEPGGFYIDPPRPVDRAVVTHGHADHARPGHGAVLATPETLAIMRARMGEGRAGDTQEALRPGEAVTHNGVRILLHPAGHVLGSAQVALEWQGSRIVVSGDYKRRADPTCAGFEPVACDVFVTEATFALPVFRHPPAEAEIARLLDSLRLFPERAHVIGVYALGKCQRLIRLLRLAGWERPIYLHGALVALCRLYEELGVPLGDLRPVPPADRKARGAAGALLAGEIVLAPPSAEATPWSRRLGRSGDLRRLGLDARAPARQGARDRAAADHLRPCRLGGAERDGGRGGRARGLGDPWPRRRAGACHGAARHPRPRPAPGGPGRGGRGRDSRG
jgi:putative mRNA 3-end processing factor